MHKDPHSTAAALLPLLGGPANVRSVAHCMTRLRLGLADRSRVEDEALRALPGVLGVVEDGDSYQVVLGPGVVGRVTEAFEALLAAGDGGASEALNAAGDGGASEALKVAGDGHASEALNTTGDGHASGALKAAGGGGTPQALPVGGGF